ncbi:MAG: diguanylate cyclase [Moraxellaceae bacterium]
MSVSLSHLGYKRLSKAIFEWQAADRAALLAVFIVIEVFLHWLWCLFVWWQQDALSAYVNIPLLYPLWFGITVMGVFFWVIARHLSHPTKKNNAFNTWQLLLVVPYAFYIAIVIVMMGYSSLFAGVTLVGGAMLGMMLIKRSYAWRLFLLQILLILLAIVAPYFGIQLPNLRYLTAIYPAFDPHNYLTYNESMVLENTIAATVFSDAALGWDSVSNWQLSTIFWRATHVFLALPKAIFIVYMFRILLLILDDSKTEILKHANQDELTQLKNRRSSLVQMKKALLKAPDGQDFSVILLDLDWFKSVNDNYGHEAGDQVLSEVAQTLLPLLTEESIVSRYGGEEFLIVLPDTNHEQAMTVAEQLRRSIADHVIHIDSDKSCQVTASLGLYTLTNEERTVIKREYENVTQKEKQSQPRPANAARFYRSRQGDKQVLTAQLPSDICQRLICIADKALYEAKNRGRDQVVSANRILESEDRNITVSFGT